MPACPYCRRANLESAASCAGCGRPLRGGHPVSAGGASRDLRAGPGSGGGGTAAAGVPVLVGQAAPFLNKQFPITASGLRIGRQPGQNQIVLDDLEVSRLHARVHLDAQGKACVEDTSVNGTFVNGRRIRQTAALNPGDQVCFGPDPAHSFVYRAEAGNGALPPEKEAAAEQAMKAVKAMAGADRSGRGTIILGPEEAPAPNARLQLILDAYAVEDIPLSGGRTTLGRRPGPQRIAIDHPTVSEQHAELSFSGGRTVLRDLGSQYGTFVNGERAAEHPLREGDLIRLGACESRLLLYREPQRRALVLRDIELNKPVVTLGRHISNQVHISHPTVSMFHAEIHKEGNTFLLIDKNSTNGTYVNGARVARHALRPRDRITLGGIQFVFDGSTIEQQTDGGAVRLAALGLHRSVRNLQSGRSLALLDDISLSIEPREFVGLLGPAGAGKSMLLYALNGTQPAEVGRVLVNNSDLYGEYAALKVGIGYLPQEDILHRPLTVYQCLYYAGRLRLPDDYGEKEIRARVEEVIRILDLVERAEVEISQLSGGQRKRVSLGLELLNKPSLLFMDEPTSGQDPRTEMRLMQLFRQIANQGATVVCTTHLLGSFSLLDKVGVLVQGKLAYFGPSQEMLAYFKAARPTEVYDRLQEKSAEAWSKQYKASELYRENVGEPQSEGTTVIRKAPVRSAPARPAPRRSQCRQAATLLRRQIELRVRGWASVAGMLVPPAVIAFLVALMKNRPNEPKTLFMIVFSALWFGCSAAVREIVDEQAIYRRERERGLSVCSYLSSKLVYLTALAMVQSGLFVYVLTLMEAQENHFSEAWGLMALMTVEGALIGLLISALCSSPEKALAIFPLALIPQLLLAGLFVPTSDLNPFLPVENKQLHRIELRPVPRELVPRGMNPILKYGISPLMVARWGLESLADVYVHDRNEGSIFLLNQVSLTFHPHDVAEARAYIDAMNDRLPGKVPAAEISASDPATPAYVAVLAGFAVVMVVLTAVAVKRKDARGQR